MLARPPTGSGRHVSWHTFWDSTIIIYSMTSRPGECGSYEHFHLCNLGVKGVDKNQANFSLNCSTENITLDGDS